jgi:hypothetical protein
MAHAVNNRKYSHENYRSSNLLLFAIKIYTYVFEAESPILLILVLLIYNHVVGQSNLNLLFMIVTVQDN